MQDTSRLLFQQLDHLAADFSDLAGRLMETADQLRNPGLPPSESLIASLTEALKSFFDLRAKILGLARDLAVRPDGVSGALASLDDLRRFAQRTAQAEEEPAAIAATRRELTVLPLTATPETSQEAERARNPVAPSWQKPLATDELAGADAAAGETLDLPADPALPTPEDLPTEVEEFLEKLIEEASQARKSGESSSYRATQNCTPPPSIPQKREIPIPEAPLPGTEKHSAWKTGLSVPEAVAGETRGQQTLADRNREQEKYAQREELYSTNNSLELAERRLGPEHTEIADLLANLALLYHKQGKYADAETLHQRELLIREKALGTEHPKVATSLNNLAALYRDQGKYEEARKHWERSLAIVEKAFGPEHPKTALRVSNLADLFYAQGEQDRAEQFYRRLLAILDNGGLEVRRDIKASLKNYLALLRGTNRQKEALQVQARMRATAADWLP